MTKNRNNRLSSQSVDKGQRLSESVTSLSATVIPRSGRKTRVGGGAAKWEGSAGGGGGRRRSGRKARGGGAAQISLCGSLINPPKPPAIGINTLVNLSFL